MTMPDTVWLTAPASEFLRQFIPVQFDHDRSDTKYISMDSELFKAYLAVEFRKGYQKGLIDSHNDALDIVADHQKENER